MKHWTIRAVICAVAAAGMGMAQSSSSSSSSSSSTTPTPPTPAQQAANLVTQLTTLLDLSSGQVTAATGYFTTMFTTLGTIQTNLQTAQTALQTAITGDSLSNVTVAADTIGNLTQQQVIAQGTAQADFYAQLDSSQQTKYATLLQSGFGPGGGFGGPGGGGPGGPGGPPPGGPPPGSSSGSSSSSTSSAQFLPAR